VYEDGGGIEFDGLIRTGLSAGVLESGVRRGVLGRLWMAASTFLVGQFIKCRKQGYEHILLELLLRDIRQRSVVHSLYEGDGTHLQESMSTCDKIKMKRIYQAGQIIARFTLKLSRVAEPINEPIPSIRSPFFLRAQNHSLDVR
jgi:hypothetical protein